MQPDEPRAPCRQPVPLHARLVPASPAFDVTVDGVVAPCHAHCAVQSKPLSHPLRPALDILKEDRDTRMSYRPWATSMLRQGQRGLHSGLITRVSNKYINITGLGNYRSHH